MNTSRPNLSRSGFNNRFDANRARIMRQGKITKALTASVFVLVALIAVASIASAIFISGSSSTCVVTDKDRTTNSEGGSDMRIYTEGCDGSSSVKVFSVSDNWFAGQFASADTFASIDVGETYNFETRGFRLPILSLFPNIVGVTEASAQ